MARFKKRAKRAKRSYGARRARHSKSNNMGLSGLVTAAGYGAARGYASNLLNPLTNKLGMLGTYADNVVMLGALYGLQKVMPSAKPIARTGMLIEAAMIGGELVGSFGKGSGAASSNLFDGGGY